MFIAVLRVHVVNIRLLQYMRTIISRKRRGPILWYFSPTKPQWNLLYRF